jgi:hypothetical protein
VGYANFQMTMEQQMPMVWEDTLDSYNRLSTLSFFSGVHFFVFFFLENIQS